MPYGSLLTDVVQSSTAGTPPQFNDGNGTQIGTLCRAWVKFVGSTGAISGAFNVSSVTRSGTGQYVVTFSNAMPNANYAWSRATDGTWYGAETSAPTTTTLAFYFTNAAANAYVDPGYVSVSVFR